MPKMCVATPRHGGECGLSIVPLLGAISVTVDAEFHRIAGLLGMKKAVITLSGTEGEECTGILSKGMNEFMFGPTPVGYYRLPNFLTSPEGDLVSVWAVPLDGKDYDDAYYKLVLETAKALEKHAEEKGEAWDDHEQLATRQQEQCPSERPNKRPWFRMQECRLPAWHLLAHTLAEGKKYGINSPNASYFNVTLKGPLNPECLKPLESIDGPWITQPKEHNSEKGALCTTHPSPELVWYKPFTWIKSFAEISLEDKSVITQAALDALREKWVPRRSLNAAIWSANDRVVRKLPSPSQATDAFVLKAEFSEQTEIPVLAQVWASYFKPKTVDDVLDGGLDPVALPN